jgi:hypothetical protein
VGGRRFDLRRASVLVAITTVAFIVAFDGVASAHVSHPSWPQTYRILKRSDHHVPRAPLTIRSAPPTRARASIVGGRQIPITQAPWQVFILSIIPIEEEKELLLLCGGSIVDATHIVTAGHCTYDPESGSPIPAGDMFVSAGTSDFNRPEAGEQEAEVASVRVHPYFEYSRGPGTPDDIAVLTLTQSLTFTSSVQPVGLVASGNTPPEGTQVNLTGFGEEVPTEFPEGFLNSLGMTVGYSRPCGGEADAVFLCASSPTGSGCEGDSGSALTGGSTPTLVGVMDTVESIPAKQCGAESEDGFVNVAAPEIQDFIDGSETPPRAPRGRGAIIRAVPEVGHAMTCEPGTWSGSPTFTYSFVSSTNLQILQSGPSAGYELTEADVGRSIYCQVSASNAGGTGMGRTPALGPIQAATVTRPPVHAAAPSPVASEATHPEAPLGSTFPSTVALAGKNLATGSNGAVTVELECGGEESCAGELTLRATQTVRKKHGRKTTRTVTIGHVEFSIAAERDYDPALRLNSTGLALLRAAHGRLTARLQITQTPPSAPETETVVVHLVQASFRSTKHKR